MCCNYNNLGCSLEGVFVKVGDLVKLKNGTTGIIVRIASNDPMSKRHPWAILHCGEKFYLRDLEVVNESR